MAYGQSKLADLVFAYELARRLTAAGSSVLSVAAHPGYASTELQSHTESIQDRFMGLGNRFIAQSAAAGARPELYAATMTDVKNGAYFGPDGIGEVRGSPTVVGSSKASRDEVVATRLWDAAVELTGVTVRGERTGRRRLTGGWLAHAPSGARPRPAGPGGRVRDARLPPSRYTCSRTRPRVRSASGSDALPQRGVPAFATVGIHPPHSAISTRPPAIQPPMTSLNQWVSR